MLFDTLRVIEAGPANLVLSPYSALGTAISLFNSISELAKKPVLTATSSLSISGLD